MNSEVGRRKLESQGKEHSAKRYGRFSKAEVGKVIAWVKGKMQSEGGKRKEKSESSKGGQVSNFEGMYSVYSLRGLSKV